MIGFVDVPGKCDPKGVLAGSNAAVMSVEFDLEVTYYSLVGGVLLTG